MKKIEVFIFEILCLDVEAPRGKPGRGRVIDPRGARVAAGTCGSLTVLHSSQGIVVVVLFVKVERRPTNQSNRSVSF